jgi:hypothetical protein
MRHMNEVVIIRYINTTNRCDYKLLPSKHALQRFFPGQGLTGPELHWEAFYQAHAVTIFYTLRTVLSPPLVGKLFRVLHTQMSSQGMTTWVGVEWG